MREELKSQDQIAQEHWSEWYETSYYLRDIAESLRILTQELYTRVKVITEQEKDVSG